MPQAGFELSLIESSGLKNVGVAARLKGLSVLPKSFLAARRLLKEFRPDIVVGAGGYVSGPVLLSASLLNIPTLVMESNALPGFTNRQLARFVDKAAVTFEASVPYFRGKAVVTGNPVRREFFEVTPKARDANSFSLLIFGGSQGARAINFTMVDALARLGEHKARLSITHQTGPHDVDKVKADYMAAGWDAQADVRQYLDNIVEQFAAADLIICRAGATTAAELVAAGKAALMIPFPLAADDHQRKNAEALQEGGAARMILQKDLTGESLANELKSLINAPDLITKMEQNARQLAKGDAAATTVDLMEGLIKNA